MVGQIDLPNGGTLTEWLEGRRQQLNVRYTARDEGRDPRVLVNCGIPELEKLGIPEMGTLMILAGHSGDGKSSLAIQFIEGAAKCGYDCQGYLFEDPAEFTADRVLSKVMGVSAVKLRRMDTSLKADQLDRRLNNLIEANSGWTDRIKLWGSKFDTRELFANIEANIKETSGLVIVDYAQVFAAEGDEKSTERVINTLAYGLNEIAKKHHVAVILLSQIDTKAVTRRGHADIRSWKFSNKNEVPDRDAIDGFRPGAGDLAWAAALGQKARSVLVAFRPAVWLKEVGVIIPDDIIEVHMVKNNFGDSCSEPVLLNWNGATTTITSRKRSVSRNESF